MKLKKDDLIFFFRLILTTFPVEFRESDRVRGEAEEKLLLLSNFNLSCSYLNKHFLLDLNSKFVEVISNDFLTGEIIKYFSGLVSFHLIVLLHVEDGKEINFLANAILHESEMPDW